MILSSLLSLSSFTALTTALTLPRASSQNTTSHILYEFPSPSWNENLISRQQQSELLITQLTAPDIYLVSTQATSDPPLLVHNFAPFAGVLGITEVEPDHFYAVAGNFSVSPPDLGIGTYTLWAIDMTTFSRAANTSATVSQVAAFPDGGLINGVATLDRGRGLVVAADSTNGALWLIDVYTGNVSVLLQEPEMAPLAANPFGIGINGVHVLPGCSDSSQGETVEIYFSNTATALFHRVPLSLSTLRKVGPVETLLSGVAVDDFALDAEGGVAYLTAGALNSLLRFGLKTGEVETVVGGVNETTLTGPTSVVLGGKGVVYITTDEGLVVEAEVGC